MIYNRSKYALIRTCLLLTNGAAAILLLVSCEQNPQGVDKPPLVWQCSLPSGADVNYARSIGCMDDFKLLASEPLDASIPGALSGKTVIDRFEDDPALYFQNSKKYEIHHAFASANLSTASKKPFVPSIGEFASEYTHPQRRFILGAITYFEGPKIWTYEIAPYDNASAEMIEFAYKKICDSTFFGDSLYFHPSSQEVAAEAAKLPADVKIITTDELYSNIQFQPLNLGTSMGRLVFVTAKELETEYVTFRDIVVLDAVPNDISVTSGIITQTFQTPLAHINVLSRNRGTPNMGLRGAFDHAQLRTLEGKWVKYEVTANQWEVSEITKEEADLWWDSHKPATVGIATMDLEMKVLKNVEDILDVTEDRSNLGTAIKSALPAFGGKATHFSAFPHMDTTKVPYPKAFAIPVYYYWHFMEDNGFNAFIDSLLEDPVFTADPAVRDSCLGVLRDLIMNTPLDADFEVTLFAKLNTEYTGTRMRFRSSTNAEDLDGFTGAGLYTSKSADPDKPKEVRNAIREVWASVWFFRAFEERSYRSIKHSSVGMALLCHQSYPTEEASGVAITANIFDPKGIEPGYYINVQKGDASVVLPDAEVTTDQIIYHMEMEGQPLVYIGHSNLIDSGTVLTKRQITRLGIALKEIHRYFQPLYGANPNAWYAMDTEFKFDQPQNDPDGEPVLFMKQARPYPPPN